MEKSKDNVNQKCGLIPLRTMEKKSFTSSSGQYRARGKKLLPVNLKIESREKRMLWKILEHLGSGGFGDVYRVFPTALAELQTNANAFPPNLKTEKAMKTELHSAQLKRLNIEWQILLEIENHCKAHNCPRHFCEPIDHGNTKTFHWIVMTLIGPSLELIRKMMARQFTKTSVIKMAFQILQALRILHDVGFIHRDLKPGNICVGCPPNDDMTLYLLDFGISRRIFRSAGSKHLRAERPKVPFFGTRKFCSRACHYEHDQGRKDDVESYIYTVLDLLHSEKGLPWNKMLGDRSKILTAKVSLFNDPKKELDPSVPAQFYNIIHYIRELKFASEVNYSFIESQLNLIAHTDKLNLADKFDWNKELEALMKENKNKSKEDAGRSSEDHRRSREDMQLQQNSGDVFGLNARPSLESLKKNS